MTACYVDTSALAKRYLVESGSFWVRGWVEPSAGNVVVICDLTPVEMFSLLERRRRERTLSATAAALLEADFLVHVEHEYLVAPVDSALMAEARRLVTKHPLRALDAIQLACAVKTAFVLGEPVTFISGDISPLSAAAAEGFNIEDPNAHA